MNSINLKELDEFVGQPVSRVADYLEGKGFLVFVINEGNYIKTFNQHNKFILVHNNGIVKKVEIG